MGFPEGSNMKAPRDSEFPFGAFLFLAWFNASESPINSINFALTLGVQRKGD